MKQNPTPTTPKKAKQLFNNYVTNNKSVCLHLGCGPRVVRLTNWLNIDLYAPEATINWDLTKKMTFAPNNSVDFIYHEHFLEHLTRKEGAVLLAECHRILRPSGVMRVVMPDLDRAVVEYMNWTPKKAQPELYKTKGEFLNMCMRGWHHRYLYNNEDLERSLRDAGFKTCAKVQYKKSNHEALHNIESRPPDQDALLWEATK
jgi:predicted SAM-dependent methyltransferase